MSDRHKDTKASEASAAPTLTGVLRKARSDADLQGFAGRLQNRNIPLTLHEQDLPRAAPAQEAPVFLLQLHLQSEEEEESCDRTRPGGAAASAPSFPHSRVIELER